MTQRDSQLKPFDFGTGEEVTETPPRRSRGWLLLLLLIVVLLGAGAAYLWYFDRDRAHRWLEKAPGLPGFSVTTAYKWRDAKGNWQITDNPPAEGIPYETIRVRSDVNIVPSVKED